MVSNRHVVTLLGSLSLAALVGCDSKSTQSEPATTVSMAADPAATKTPQTPPDPAAELDGDMKSVLGELAAMNGKPIETLSAEEARRQPTPADAVKALLQKQGKSLQPIEMAHVDEKTAPVQGGSLPIRVYTPTGAKAPLPVVVYFHGGGFVIATNDTYDASARGLADGAKALVLSVEYRKAPEHKFPQAHDDAFAAYLWARSNAASLGGDPKKIALVGESAGGNLAANVAIAARDKHEPPPLAQVLVYPVASPDTETQSYVQYADAKPLNKAMMLWFTNQYFRTPADGKDPRIDLVHANLAGLPPTTIINAQIDPLRSDGDNLTGALRSAGVQVEQKVYDGVTHEFFGMGVVVADAKEAMEFASVKLKAAFGH